MSSTKDKSSNYPFMIRAWTRRQYDSTDCFLMEFFGSFCLNLALTMHSNSRLQQEDQPYAVMLTIILIVVIGAPISGAHYNPNITLAFWMTGDKKSPSNALYILITLIGALTAQLCAYGLDGYDGGLPVYNSTEDWVRCAFAEGMSAFITTLLVMYTASVADPPLGIWGPIFAAFGFFLNCIFFRDVSGAIINPAVAFGLWIVGIIEGNQEKKWNIVLYVLSELIGAFLAGGFTHFVMWRQRVMKAIDDEPSVRKSKGIVDQGAHLEAAA